MTTQPYNPLAKKNLGASVAEALLLSPPQPLNSLTSFEGAGIYAIYYTGDYTPYEELSNRNRNGKFNAPIYIGKAVPPGARKGGFGLDAPPGPAMYKRLKEHAESIKAVENLHIDDFYCRYLVVDDIWIPLGESLLISKFSPIWNQHIDGFGNHDPGSGRYNQLRSRWDLLHPGRSWALKCKEREESPETVANEIKNYLEQFAFPEDPHVIEKI